MTPFAQQLLAWTIILLLVILAGMLLRRLWIWFRAVTPTNSTRGHAVKPISETAAPVSPNSDPVLNSGIPRAPGQISQGSVTATQFSPAPYSTSSSLLTQESVSGSVKIERLDPESLPFADKRDYAFGMMTPLLASLLPESEARRSEIKRALINAGDYTPHAYQNFSATRYLGIVVPILFFGVLLLVVPARLEPLMIAGLVVGPILGWSLPTILVRSQAAQRLQEIETAMPDMLDLLNMCVSQGMTITPALARVGQELENVYPALAQELKIVAEQARINHLEQALTNFSDRVDVPQVHSFTALLIQTERMGTSVSRALTDYSDNMREMLRQRADQKANSAAFKLLFPTVLCLMPAVFLFLMGPAIIQLSDFFTQGGSDILESGQAVQIQALQPIETRTP